MIAYRPPLFKGARSAPSPSMVVGDVSHRVPPISPDDSIARAAEAIRQSPAGAVPVAEDGRIVGIVSVAELKSALAGGGVQQVRVLPVQTIMATDLLCLRE